jgi:hypothetical protein
MLDGQSVGSLHDPTNPVTFVNGKITVDVGLGALYQELAPESAIGSRRCLHGGPA